MAELGLLAFHWYAAHDQPEAFRASVRAGMAARTYGGPEAVTHLERALELYDQVPDDDPTSPPRPTWSACWRRPARNTVSTTAPAC